jgi:hypothetical protein
MSAQSAAKPEGKPDFDKAGNVTVEGDVEKVASSGTPDFEKGGGQKTVKGPGEPDMSKAYETEKKSHSADSYF